MTHHAFANALNVCLLPWERTAKEPEQQAFYIHILRVALLVATDKCQGRIFWFLYTKGQHVIYTKEGKKPFPLPLLCMHPKNGVTDSAIVVSLKSILVF